MRLLNSLVLGILAMFALATAASAAPPALDPENTLVIELKSGKVTIQLRPDLAPKHVERVKKLAREGFYDGIVFHRVIPGFMAQTGDPLAALAARPSGTSAAPSARRAPPARTRRTASSSSASPTRPTSTASTRCGGRWWTA